MFLTVHATAALALSQNVSNPWLAFIFGLISHNLLDAVPHGDRDLTPWINKKVNLKKTLVILTLFDLLCLALSTFFFLKTKNINYPVSALAAMTGGVLPDFLVGMRMLLNLNWLEKVISFNEFSHKLLPSLNKKISFLSGLIIQIIFLVFFWYLI